MKKKTFYSIVTLQVLFLIGMILFNQSILWWGQPIILETAPVDPHSLFSGEYVALNYQISDLKLDQVAHSGFANSSEARKYYPRGSKVYVQLEKQGDTWQAVAISKNRHDMQGKLYISGRVEWVSEWWENNQLKEPPRIHIKYGIESYYTPEGQARYYEYTDIQSLRVKVALDPLGRSKVVELLPQVR